MTFLIVSFLFHPVAFVKGAIKSHQTFGKDGYKRDGSEEHLKHFARYHGPADVCPGYVGSYGDPDVPIECQRAFQHL